MRSPIIAALRNGYREDNNTPNSMIDTLLLIFLIDLEEENITKIKISGSIIECRLMC